MAVLDAMPRQNASFARAVPRSRRRACRRDLVADIAQSPLGWKVGGMLVTLLGVVAIAALVLESYAV